MSCFEGFCVLSEFDPLMVDVIPVMGMKMPIDLFIEQKLK